MSWVQTLAETYDACFGKPAFTGKDALTPIDHIEQQAHIEITIDENGNFVRAGVVEKENTLMPATEKSAGRASDLAAHPLCDKLRYVAADFGSKEEHDLYSEQLRAWTQLVPNAKLNAVLRYVERGTVIQDLVEQRVLMRNAQGELERDWKQGYTPLAKLLATEPKTKQRDQGSALVRWIVNIPGTLETAVWKDPEIQQAWADFCSQQKKFLGICLVSGERESLATKHPKRLRHGGDSAKLISANDKKGFTFRGRFSTADEAYGLSSRATQKAHNALRWLIHRQSARNGDQAIVAWEIHGAPTPPVAASTLEFYKAGDTWDLFGEAEEETKETQPAELKGIALGSATTIDDGYRAGQEFALKLRKSIRGYAAKLGAHNNVVVMAMDSATPGRMGILYYQELAGSTFLERIERWHSSLAWPQNFGKEQHFVGAPSPRDIAEAAYGRRVDDKLLKATVERLLPCIVDGVPLPRDLVRGAATRAANRPGMEHWEFERVLGVACSLIKASRKDERYQMSLEEDRTTRSYLFGRLLAVAEQLESYALFLAKESRDTAAERLMQRFADHPAETWRTLELSLRPYMQRLRSQRPGVLHDYKKLLDEISAKFLDDEFTRSGRLDPEFLLGYHCQRAALRPAKTSPEAEPITPESIPE